MDKVPVPDDVSIDDIRAAARTIRDAVERTPYCRIQDFVDARESAQIRAAAVPRDLQQNIGRNECSSHTQ